MIKYVVAGTYDEYRSHLKKNNYNPKDYRYVSSVLALHGLTDIQGFYIGRYAERVDIQEIREKINNIKFVSKIYGKAFSYVILDEL